MHVCVCRVFPSANAHRTLSEGSAPTSYSRQKPSKTAAPEQRGGLSSSRMLPQTVGLCRLGSKGTIHLLDCGPDRKMRLAVAPSAHDPTIDPYPDLKELSFKKHAVLPIGTPASTYELPWQMQGSKQKAGNYRPPK